MRAFAIDQAGQPAAPTTIPDGDIGPRDVRIAVEASSVNGFDVFQSLGYLAGMMEHRYPAVIGRDLAGVVDAIGNEVTDVAVGDAVVGFVPATPPLEHGSWAERVTAANLVLAARPAGLDALDAAALPLAGSAALDLLDAIDASAGDTLLIVGATGGVGAFVVQLAVARGLTVVATARPDEVAFITDLGATETIDYTAGSVVDAVRARFPHGVDALIDLVSQADALAELAALIRDGGHIASLLGAVDEAGLARRGITGTNVNATPTPAKLESLAGLVAAGTLRVSRQAVFGLDQAADAVAAFQAGTRGKIIIRIG